jgi:hypothetical protein
LQNSAVLAGLTAPLQASNRVIAHASLQMLLLLLPFTNCTRISASVHYMALALQFDEQLGIYMATAFLLSPAMYCTK